MITILPSGGIIVGGVFVEMHSEGDAILRMMRNGKIWEPETRAAWTKLVEPDRAVIDIGAYTGVYAIASALMGSKVVALEPHPANFLRLKTNAAINSVRIDMHEVAASDVCMPFTLRMRKPAAVINDIATLEGADEGVPVRAVTIDGMRIDRDVGLIKIDVEGHELRVLRGARLTIVRHKPLILVELLTKAAQDQVSTLLRDLGYVSQVVFDRRNYLYAT